MNKFSELPIFIQINILAWVDVSTFENIRKMKELQHLHTEYPYKENLYHLRSEIFYPEHLDLKKEFSVPWSDYYNLTHRIVTYAQGPYSLQYYIFTKRSLYPLALFIRMHRDLCTEFMVYYALRENNMLAVKLFADIGIHVNPRWITPDFKKHLSQETLIALKDLFIL